MSIATMIVALLTATNPNAASCATIDNVMNEASWQNRRGRIVVATYEDNGERLTYSRPVPRQVLQAEEAMQWGKPGPKTITVCS